MTKVYLWLLVWHFPVPKKETLYFFHQRQMGEENIEFITVSGQFITACTCWRIMRAFYKCKKIKPGILCPWIYLMTFLCPLELVIIDEDLLKEANLVSQTGSPLESGFTQLIGPVVVHWRGKLKGGRLDVIYQDYRGVQKVCLAVVVVLLLCSWLASLSHNYLEWRSRQRRQNCLSNVKHLQAKVL